MTWHHCPKCGRDLYPHTARLKGDGWVCADATGCANVVRAAALVAARREDLQWMVETGENLIGAARRLKLPPEALERWLYRHAPELRAVLVQRVPFGFTARQVERDKAEARGAVA